MTYRIKGTLKLPSGQPAAGVDVEFISRRNYSPLLMDLSSIIKTTSTGAYDITLQYGEYAVVVYWGCNQPSHIGKLFVFSDTVPGLDLQTLLQQADWQPATPEYIQQIQDWLAQAGSFASQAADSAAAAKASEVAAEADRAEVANSKEIVIDAQADVAEKQRQAAISAANAAESESASASSAASASASATIADQKRALAEAAANTASQKAASAAESDASARYAATRAENAALAMTGAILDGGECDLSSGFYPQPLTVNGQKYSTVWYVQVGGTVGSVTYDAGDKLQYTTANNGFYFRIDARDEVVSVNGKKGAVVISAQDVGADQDGTASALVSQHKTELNAHSPQQVGADPEGTASSLVAQHKQEANAHTPQNVGADPAGTADNAIAALKAESNPFPQYSDFRCGEERDFATRKQLEKRADEYHPMDGQLVQRATDQGLLAAILAGEVPSCSDADWLADPAKRGCYTLGDGSTTIRIADLNGKSSGNLWAPVIRGDGKNAAQIGEIQEDCIRNITGRATPKNIAGSWTPVGGFAGAFDAENVDGSVLNPSGSTSTFSCGINFDASRVVKTGPENRMVNTAKVRAVKR